MNLFVAGWNCSPEARATALSALRSMHETFPLLDSDSVGRWDCGRGFAAWMIPCDKALGPRRYVHTDGEELILYDGNVIDPSMRCEAHDARSLLAHWSQLTDLAEGRFIAIRLSPERFELINDPYGIHQTFVHEDGATFWVSNSMRLLARATGCETIDLEAMAQFVGMKFVAGARSFVQGISVLPAGQHWISRDGAPATRTTYAPVSELARIPKRSFVEREAVALAADLGASLKVLSRAFGLLECPITGGRDSRMLTGLMLAGGYPGEFFSVGESDSSDVKFGAEIADRMGLSHRHIPQSGPEVVAAWDEISRRVIRQYDGTVTLQHAANALHPPDRLDRIAVLLYGVAGELGRGVRLSEHLILSPPNLGRTTQHVQGIYLSKSELVRPEAAEGARAYVESACRTLQDQGFASVDIPDAFDLTEYARRWAGAQARQRGDYKDVIAPFLTRPYMRAAFATPPRERLMERVPQELLRHLSPELLALPFDKPLPPERFLELVLRHKLKRLKGRLGRKFRFRQGRVRSDVRGSSRAFVLASQLPQLRERFLDDHRSDLWQVIDRNRFEILTSDRTAPSELHRHMTPLYRAVTALSFEADFKEWILEPSPADIRGTGGSRSAPSTPVRC